MITLYLSHETGKPQSFRGMNDMTREIMSWGYNALHGISFPDTGAGLGHRKPKHKIWNAIEGPWVPSIRSSAPSPDRKRKKKAKHVKPQDAGSTSRRSYQRVSFIRRQTNDNTTRRRRVASRDTSPLLGRGVCVLSRDSAQEM